MASVIANVLIGLATSLITGASVWLRTLPPDRFCVILRVTAPGVYGHESVVLERDVTAEAFAASA